MKIEVLTNKDHVVFIKYYPGLAIVFEPDVTGKNAICPSDIFVRDLDTIKDFMDYLLPINKNNDYSSVRYM